MFYCSECESPVGTLTIASDGQAVCGLWLDGQKYHGATIHPGTRVYLSWGEKESDKPGALGKYTANALEVCRALLGKGAAVDPYMQPDGTHCEACWAKQVLACMDFLFGGKYE